MVITLLKVNVGDDADTVYFQVGRKTLFMAERHEHWKGPQKGRNNSCHPGSWRSFTLQLSARAKPLFTGCQTCLAWHCNHTRLGLSHVKYSDARKIPKACAGHVVQSEPSLGESGLVDGRTTSGGWCLPARRVFEGVVFPETPVLRFNFKRVD
jgi:hypothetical protein